MGKDTSPRVEQATAVQPDSGSAAPGDGHIGWAGRKHSRQGRNLWLTAIGLVGQSTEFPRLHDRPLHIEVV